MCLTLGASQVRGLQSHLHAASGKRCPGCVEGGGGVLSRSEQLDGDAALY